jgi:hypothetical protein
VLNCNTSHMNSGVHIISVLDLGGIYHLQKTLRHEVVSDDLSSYSRGEVPDDIFENLAKTLSTHQLNQLFYIERFFHTDIEWSFENRRFVINESSNYKCWLPSLPDAHSLMDETVIPLPIRRIEYVQDLIDTGTYKKVNTIVD